MNNQLKVLTLVALAGAGAYYFWKTKKDLSAQKQISQAFQNAYNALAVKLNPPTSTTLTVNNPLG